MTSFIRDYGPRMVENGLSLVPIAYKSKRPIGREWQKNPLSAEACKNYFDPSAGLGVLFGVGENPIYGVDADIDGDEEFAEAFKEKVREITKFDMTRVGKPPKFLAFARLDGPPKSKRTSSYFVKDGRRIRLEFLGKGQQAVVLGIHPDTGRAYQWDSLLCDITEFEPEFLPVITVHDVDVLFETFVQMAKDRGYKEEDFAAEQIELGDPVLMSVLEPPIQPVGLPVKEAGKLLRESGISNSDYETWIRVGMALHHEFYGSEEAAQALDLWDEWSSTADSYEKPDRASGLSGRQLIEAKWQSFGHGKARNITFRWIQRQWRKVNTEASYAQELNETGIVFRFLKKFGETVRYVQDEAAWFVYDGRYWEPMDKSERKEGIRWMIQSIVLEDMMREGAEKMQEDAEEGAKILAFCAKRKSNLGWIPRVESQLRASSALWARSTDFDMTRRFFAMSNGIFDLLEYDFLAFNPDYLIHKHTNVAFEWGKKAPLWERTVRECFSDNEEKIAYFKRWCGYTLLGNPKECKFHIFEGDGANGKSLLLDTLGKVHGGYHVAVSPGLFTSKTQEDETAERPQPVLASIQGMRLITCAEGERGSKLREAAVKRITGRDLISARKMYGKAAITFKPQAVVVMATNYKPEVMGIDNGIWRRQEYLRFERNFELDPTVELDPNRGEKLALELPGIFNWMIEGLKDYREKGGLCPPECVQREVEVFRDEMDVLGQWLKDCWEITGNKKDVVKMSFLWRKWGIFAKEANFWGVIQNQNQLTRRMRTYLSRFPDTEIFRSGGNTKIAGIRPVKDDGSADVEEANRAAEDFQKKE